MSNGNKYRRRGRKGDAGKRTKDWQSRGKDKPTGRREESDRGNYDDREES